MTLQARAPGDSSLAAGYKALGEALDRRVKRLVASCFRDLGDPRAWAEDAAGEAWVACLDHYADQIEETARYLSSGVRNDEDEKLRQKRLALMTVVARHWLSKNVKHKTVDLDLLVEVIADSAAEDLERRLDRARARQVLKDLLSITDAVVRDPMLDLFGGKLTQREVAEKHGRGRVTIASDRRRILARIREVFVGSARSKKKKPE